MNPAIHHPAWYHSVGALTDDELAHTGAVPAKDRQPRPAVQGTPGIAVAGPNMPICTPAFAQFTAGHIRVVCINQSWTISTPDKTSFLRIRDIATRVFMALGHTPVSAYGLNFSYHRRTKLGNVAVRLAQFVEAMPLGFDKFQHTERSAKIAYTTSAPGRDFNVSVEPSVRGSDVLFVGINAHHPILLPTPGFQQFDLGPLLGNSTENDLRDAQSCLSRILATFGGSDQ